MLQSRGLTGLVTNPDDNRDLGGRDVGRLHLGDVDPAPEDAAPAERREVRRRLELHVVAGARDDLQADARAFLATACRLVSFVVSSVRLFDSFFCAAESGALAFSKMAARRSERRRILNPTRQFSWAPFIRSYTCIYIYIYIYIYTALYLRFSETIPNPLRSSYSFSVFLQTQFPKIQAKYFNTCPNQGFHKEPAFQMC